MRTILEIKEALRALPGSISYYYEDLITGAVETFEAERSQVAASVIKLPILVEAMRQIDAGEANPDEQFIVTGEQKMPSCGALSYMHDGLAVTLTDLATLMIILSDNTATNLLIDRLGMENVNRTAGALGLEQTCLRRRLFDAEASARGIENTVSARDMGRLLSGMYRGQVVSEHASAAMLKMLADQRLNGKLPFYLHALGIPVAHKTGEDSGITHDVGIVYAGRPFVVCILTSGTDVARAERTMQDVALALYRRAEA